jgi:hypothetical protein
MTNWVCNHGIPKQIVLFRKHIISLMLDNDLHEHSYVCLQVCIVFGVALMVVSPIGGLRQIILDAKTYKFFN